MPIDPQLALSAEPTTREISWTARDVQLYHLSVGAAPNVDPFDPQLTWTYEKNLQVLPTFAMVAGGGISAGDDHDATSGLQRPGIDVNLYKVLHAGQTVTVHAPIPTAGSATVATKVVNVWDKGKAAVIEMGSEATAEDGTVLWSNVMQVWARGEGGFDGEPGPDSTWSAPERAADHVLTTPTTANQAVLYRLNGDLNPLHIDPEFAAMAGFDQPILHGLCSYGSVARTVVDHLLGGEAARLKSLSTRFAGSITPGQTIETSVWVDGDRLLLSSTCPERDNAPVLTHAIAEVG